MSRELICTPEGRFLLEGEDEAVAAWERQLFENGDAAALPDLACDSGASPDAGVDWLRRFARRWLARVCQTRTPAPPAPAEEWMDRLLALPPMRGAEYVTADTLTRLWEGAGGALAAACAETDGGLEAWLGRHGAEWHLVGRVTFHLAENKRDAERPFAFLATYIDNVNAGGKPQHLPLGRALQTYAQAADQATLRALMGPVSHASELSPLVKELLESRAVFQALRWGPEEAWRFIRALPALEEAGLVVKVPDWWKGGRPARAKVTVTLETEKSMIGVNAMLRLAIETTLDGEPITDEEWAKIRAAPAGLINLRGQWVEIDRGRLNQVLAHWEKVAAAHAAGGLTFHEGMRYLSGFRGFAGAEEEEEDAGGPSWAEVAAGKNLAAALAEWRDPAAPSVKPNVNATLRPYQEKGVAWLAFMRRLGLGACLADDMGLGKTLQVVALLTLAKPPGPALLVVPASLVGNWCAEFAKFAPQLRVFALHPSRTPREEIAAALTDPARAFAGYDAVVTTYGLLHRTEALRSLTWEAVILDEAQAIKNPGAGQTKSVKKTEARWRLALTGTPVENRAGDLWSLFDFLNPGLLGKPAEFAAVMKSLGDSPRGFAPLRKLAQPYILRRLKTDRSIISDLPDKTEMNALCGLSRKQAVLYAKLIEQLKLDLNDPALEPMQRRGAVVSYLMKFKQVCNHPAQWSGAGVYTPEDSGKFLRLAELCADIAERQERVIVFTQFREMMDPLNEYLTGIFRRPGLQLHGGTPVAERQKLVTKFQEPGGPPFFLLSVKAGGTGLTLTAASHVIHFDRWWNPAVEDQATDRAYRIGQKRNVLVHKFVCAGTIEERIDEMIHRKKALATDLLGGADGAETALTEMSDDELLRFVALDAAAATFDSRL